MNEFKLNATDNTPHIEGSKIDGIISIRGICKPEDSVTFFRPFLNWLSIFKMVELKHIRLYVDLKYVNTSSGMILFKTLSGLKSHFSDRLFEVYWEYDQDDEDMRLVGEDFKYMLGDIIKVKVKRKAL
ncbi:DUF1987 domain-containing protein [Paracrocinitomix mangrovi]|uniref:SiaC family regulatory phosphoprotein n=1 Tax=Paracrocinitomix mangrovi TaxID=2862509 RepID=UPI001C8E55F0|nr:SiaC family regulatory phosphoprotein [Paracrocinitomix mangrovi]UKN02495.1 DUF1987 domain-containing protein [Paracrocinitomix mangrovi]